MTAIERGTIYWGTCFSYRKMEAKEITVEIGRSAQFNAAIIVTCTEKRRRKRSQLTMTDGRLVILNGWGHPSAGETYDAGRPVAPDSTATIHMTRYPMSDPRWHSEFDAFLTSYLASSGATIAADYRNHDYQDTSGPHFYPRDLTPEMPVVVWGARAGEIVPRQQWERGYAPKEEFANLAEAQKLYPDLSLEGMRKSRFAGPTVDTRNGKPWSRFDTIEHWHWIMAD